MSEAITKIIDEMKALDSSNKAEFNTKFNELSDKLKTINEDYDKRFKSLDEQRDIYIKEHIQPMINTAIEELKKANVTKSEGSNKMPDPKIYGKNFGEFLYKVRKNQMELKGLSENVGSDGGFLVPEVWSNEVNKISLETSLVRGKAKVIQMPSITFKIPNVKYSNNTDGNQFGGVIAYWSDEATAVSKSNPTFEYTELNTNKLMGYADAPEELNQDAFIAIAPLLQSLFGEVIAFKEDVAFLSGNGVGKPLGIISAPCTVTVSRATASTINPIDIVKMISRFKGSLDRAVFVINQTCLPQIYTLQDNNGNFIFSNNYNTSMVDKMAGTLYGIPMIISEKAPALGSTADLGLYDFGQYLIGDREGLRVEESMHYQFNIDKNTWRFVKRVDGKPWMKNPITPYLGGSTLSPFVVLV